jgi:hypothetical protein
LTTKQYEFTGLHDIKTVGGFAGRVAQQFTPSSWTAVQWQPTATIKRFLTVQVRSGQRWLLLASPLFSLLTYTILTSFMCDSFTTRHELMFIFLCHLQEDVASF